MQTFVAVFDQMLFLFTCILIGFFLRRTGVIPEESATVVSRIESIVCIPALILSVTLNNNDIGIMKTHSVALLYAAAVVLLSCAIGCLLAPKLTDDLRHLGIFRYSLVFANFGFMGQSVIQGVFGDDMLFAYLIFQLPAAIVLYTFGVAWLTEKKSKLSWKLLLNPAYVSMAIGMFVGLSGYKLPSFMTKTISGFASCYSPLAMILTGIVIAKHDIKKLFYAKNIYIVTLIRLIFMPLLFYGLCQLVHASRQIVILVLTFSAMPLGLNTIIYPAATGGDEMPGASMAVISNIMGLVTVPLIFSLVL